MRQQLVISFVVSLLILVRKSCDGKSLIIPDTSGITNNSLIDSTKKKPGFLAIKINPTQFLFNEIPLSFEFFLPKNKSIQIQFGYIFPFDKDYYNSLKPTNPLQWLLTFKDETDYLCDKTEHMRVSPYNSRGFSVKLNYRIYTRIFYISPQVTYKYSYYKESSWYSESKSSISYTQTESKYANVIGVGCNGGK